MSKPKHTQVLKRRMRREESIDFDEARRAWEYYSWLHADSSSSSNDSRPEIKPPSTDESGLDAATGGEAQNRVDLDTLMNMPTSSSDSSEPSTIEGMMTTRCDGIITAFSMLTVVQPTRVDVQRLPDGEGWRLLEASGSPLVNPTKKPWRQSACFTRKLRPSERRVDRRGHGKKKPKNIAKVPAVVPAHEQVD